MQQRRRCLALAVGQRTAQAPLRHPLDAPHRQAAVARNIRGLARPRRHRAQPGRDNDFRARSIRPIRCRLAIRQQRPQPLQHRLAGRCVKRRHMNKPRLHARHPFCHRLQAWQQLPRAELAQGIAALEKMNVLGHGKKGAEMKKSGNSRQRACWPRPAWRAPPHARKRKPAHVLAANGTQERSKRAETSG